MAARGTFIVIEGGDGAGKDTQIELLKRDFPDFVYTREPGGTELGKLVRKIVFHNMVGDIDVKAELFLMFADRAQHIGKVVEPALRAGKTVVSNRSWLSSLAYQIYGRDRHDMEPFLRSAIDLVYKYNPIDLAIVLDIPPEVGLARQRAMGKELDSMEAEDREVHERVRQGFLENAPKLPFAKIIDANRSVEAVYWDVKMAVEIVLQR